MSDVTPILDREIFDELLSLQARRNPRLVASLVDRFEEDGATQLGALRAAASAAATEEVHRLAHAVKGWSATLGALEVVALCREIEAACHSGATAGLALLIGRLELAHARALEALRRASNEG